MGLLPKPNVTVTLTNQTIIRIILLVVVTLLGLKFLNSIAHPLVLVFVAFFFALALNPAVSWISHKLKSKSRARATGVAYIFVLTILISFFSLVIPPLVRQTVDFISTVPSELRALETEDTALGRFARKHNLNDEINNLSSDFSSRFSDIREPVINTASRVGGTLVSVITVLVLTFMMLVEGPYWMAKFWDAQPEAKRAHRKQIAQRMYRVVTGYVNGQLLIALIASGFALLALLIGSTVFDTRVNAVALAGIIALTGLIPMIGNMLGASVVVLVCLFSSTPLAIAMAVFFLLYQQIENVTIQPYVQSRTNELTPLLVFIAALLGIGFGGLLGGLVAIPAAGCAKILFEDYYARHRTS